MKTASKRIIHIDMDAFFAAVEQRDHPHYRGKPVIVGGSPESRGVVSTCSYEARKFGVRSAMPSYLARKLCPKGIFIPGRYEVYKEVSKCLMDIFSDFTPLVESLSLDEAFLDVTDTADSLKHALSIARKIKDRVRRELQLTASAGVSYNKFLAKIASDMDKPDGLLLITPNQATDILDNLEIRSFFGIGKVNEQKMLNLGVKTGKDLKKLSLGELAKHFGQAGKFYYDIVRGIDERPIVSYHIRKSIGKERTLPVDSYDIWEMSKVLEGLAIDVAGDLQSKELRGRTITVKIKYDDFQLNTRTVSLNYFVNQAEQIGVLAKQIFEANYNREKGVRLLGISISGLDNEEKDDLQIYIDFNEQPEH